MAPVIKIPKAQSAFIEGDSNRLENRAANPQMVIAIPGYALD
jgi:hypothetical protein